MIFVVPYLTGNTDSTVASVLIVEADTFTAAEQQAVARFNGAVRVGDAVELDLGMGSQAIEVWRGAVREVGSE